MTQIRAASVAALAACAAGVCLAQAPARPVIRKSVNDTSPPLHTIRPIPPRAGALLELPRKLIGDRLSRPPAGPDSAVQSAPGIAPEISVGVSFEGINNRDGVLPPDTVGAVGPNHVVQAVNLSFAVYSKAGTVLYGPAHINTLWSGFPGQCGTSNDGDPVVLYDQLADRFVISQFALPNYPFGPFYQCIAVSQTGAPAGSWHRYEFMVSNTKMNDYPKLAVWPDGYYMSINQFNQSSLTWAGAGAAVFERDKMLLGQTARMVYFDLYNVNRNLGGMLPSSLDGATRPPAGSPNYFAEFDDDAWGYSPDQVQFWTFHTDWNAPANSTFTFKQALPTAAFDSNMCRGSRNCIPQPGGARVDAISDRLMFRLAYRVLPDREAMVANHTVDVGADHAGIRWYEFAKTGAGWTIRQQSTYAPDGNHRWMGSIAMDQFGNIGLGFSISSASLSPSIRYTGRLASDPLNQMTQAETTLVAGSGYQTHSSGRWGDYSAMVLDPSDDATFWYTQEYYASVSSAGWQTRFGSFTLAGAPPPPPSTKLHIAGLTGVSVAQGKKNWVARVTATVRDQDQALYSGATVTGAWSGGASGTGACTTAATGTCTVNSPTMRNNAASATFTVTGITAAGATYDPSANVTSSVTVTR